MQLAPAAGGLPGSPAAAGATSPGSRKEQTRLVKKTNLAQEFSAISERWAPVVVAELNGQEVKLVKCWGEFQWHSHSQEDELFLVVSGKLRIDLENESIQLSAGEFFVVPKGARHRPVGEAEVLLFEPASTVRTGDGD
jgi:mannose-6-phosphate isomerase-like protein (cupin superfamily)